MRKSSNCTNSLKSYQRILYIISEKCVWLLLALNLNEIDKSIGHHSLYSTRKLGIDMLDVFFLFPFPSFFQQWFILCLKWFAWYTDTFQYFNNFSTKFYLFPTALRLPQDIHVSPKALPRTIRFPYHLVVYGNMPRVVRGNT